MQNQNEERNDAPSRNSTPKYQPPIQDSIGLKDATNGESHGEVYFYLNARLVIFIIFSVITSLKINIFELGMSNHAFSVIMES